jgi:hypothetical protein
LAPIPSAFAFWNSSFLDVNPSGTGVSPLALSSGVPSRWLKSLDGKYFGINVFIHRLPTAGHLDLDSVVINVEADRNEMAVLLLVPDIRPGGYHRLLVPESEFVSYGNKT